MSKNFTFGDKLIQDISLLRANEEFLADIERIQNKYDLPIPPGEDFRDSDTLLDVEKSSEYSKDIDELREKYNLFPIHDIFLQIFIQNGKIDSDPEEIVERVYLNPYFQIIDDNKKCVNLKIYPGTTIKDIQKNWPRIKYALDEILKSDKRRNKSKNIERDFEILRLKKSGKKYSEIASEINKKFKDQQINYWDVSKIIKRLKDKTPKNIPPKES